MKIDAAVDDLKALEKSVWEDRKLLPKNTPSWKGGQVFDTNRRQSRNSLRGETVGSDIFHPRKRERAVKLGYISPKGERLR